MSRGGSMVMAFHRLFVFRGVVFVCSLGSNGTSVVHFSC